MEATNSSTFLVLTDHLTCSVQVYAITNKSAKIAADPLNKIFLFRYGIPGRTSHDLGTGFSNNLFPQLSKLFEIKRLRTKPSHPKLTSKLNG